MLACLCGVCGIVAATSCRLQRRWKGAHLFVHTHLLDARQAAVVSLCRLPCEYCVVGMHHDAGCTMHGLQVIIDAQMVSSPMAHDRRCDHVCWVVPMRAVGRLKVSDILEGGLFYLTLPTLLVSRRMAHVQAHTVIQTNALVPCYSLSRLCSWKTSLSYLKYL